MACFKRNFIICLILSLGFLFNFSIWAASEPDRSQGAKKQTIHKGSKKKPPRIHKKKHKKPKKKKKERPEVKKKQPAPEVRNAIPVIEEKAAPVETPFRPSVLGEAGSIQNLLENEIIHLKAIRHLLPGDEISLQLYDLNSKNLLADINGNVIRNAASLIKLYVMLAVFEAIARQELPETAEIERHLYRMIAISDNGATNALILRLGQGDVLQGLTAVNALVRKMGFSGTRLKELIPDGGKTYANQTSAADTTLFFRLLYEQKLISPYYSQKMKDILVKNIHDRIKTPQIKGDGVAVADKTGYVRGLNGDCGIVYQGCLKNGSDYALSIIIENKSRPSDGSWGRKKSRVIRHLSNRIYQTLKNGQSKS